MRGAGCWGWWWYFCSWSSPSAHSRCSRTPNEATPTARQIEALLAQKAQRTPAQRKLSSQLLDMVGSQQPQESEGGAHRRDSDKPTLAKLVTVDIRADVTPALLARIRALGGTVINSVPKYRAIRAELPLNALERLAALAAVQTIRPADEAVTRKNSQDKAGGMDAR